MKINSNNTIVSSDGIGSVLGKAWKEGGVWFGQFYCQTYEVEELTDYENGTEEVEVPYFAAATFHAGTKSGIADAIRDIRADTMWVPFGGADVRYADLCEKRDAEWHFRFIRFANECDLLDKTGDYVDRVLEDVKAERAAAKREAERRFEPTADNLSIVRRHDTSAYYDAVITDGNGERHVVKEYEAATDGPNAGKLFCRYYGHKYHNADTLKVWIIENIERFDWDDSRNKFRAVYVQRGIKIDRNHDADQIIVRPYEYGAKVAVRDYDGSIINVGLMAYAMKRVPADPAEPDGDYEVESDASRVLPPFKPSTEKHYGSFVEGGTDAGRQWIIDNVAEIRVTADGDRVGLMRDGTIAKA